jgi:hypothetical protein
MTLSEKVPVLLTFIAIEQGGYYGRFFLSFFQQFLHMVRITSVNVRTILGMPIYSDNP